MFLQRTCYKARGRPMVAEKSQVGSWPGWALRYEELGQEVELLAPAALPSLFCSPVNVDECFVMSGPRLGRLVAEGRAAGGLASELSCNVQRHLAAGSDAELGLDWPEGLNWVRSVLGPPERVQVGGTGPQAAWAVSALGAPTIMSLGARTEEVVGVLPPTVMVCSDGSVLPVGEVAMSETTGCARHHILEFPLELPGCERVRERSQRLIVRFGPLEFGIDEEFLAMQPSLCRGAGGGLLAGLNAIPLRDGAGMHWVKAIARSWMDGELGFRHLELGDSSECEVLRSNVLSLRGLVSSVGLSLTEMWKIWGGSRDVSLAALDLAAALGCGSVVVHADHWSLCVHQEDPRRVIRRLMAGNLLAAVRAGSTAPQGILHVPEDATYSEDIPSAGRLKGGWRVDCCPAPHLRRPASTIGLGDTFTGGMLLAEALREHR